jgi:Type IV secretion system pilin
MNTNLLAQATSFFLQCKGDKKYYGSNESICTFQDLLDLGYRVLHFTIFTLAPTIVVFACVYGAFRVMTSAGNPAVLKNGKDVIGSALIGLIIVWSAWIIVNTFFYLFGITLPCNATWHTISPVC